MTAASSSVSRLIWNGAKKQPKGLRVVWAVIGIIGVLVLPVMMAIAFWQQHGLRLDDIAFGLMLNAWILGSTLVTIGGFVANTQWIAERDRRSRTEQYAASPEATALHLDRDSTTGLVLRTEGPIEPNPGVIALPVLTCLGTACLGFSTTMLIAQKYVGHDFVSGRFATTLSLLTLGTFLLTALGLVGRMTQAVYRWAGEHAAAAAT